MATPKHVRQKIEALKDEYDALRQGKEQLLTIIEEAEIPESVYNSNAIESSTLTLRETEQILLEEKVTRDVSLREVYEAKNLARIGEYIQAHPERATTTKENILLLHQMLMGGIDDSIAGRFREAGEYVRIGSYIAPAPEHIECMVETILGDYNQNRNTYLLDAIAKFHLDFETIHPFNDGNGRMGRVVINYQLKALGFPGIIIRDKEKKEYYATFKEFYEKKNTRPLEKILSLMLMESLHKRIAYLKGEIIVPVTEYARSKNKSVVSLLNAARRQTIPAFREKGVWKIGKEFTGK